MFKIMQKYHFNTCVLLGQRLRTYCNYKNDKKKNDIRKQLHLLDFESFKIAPNV